MQKPEFSGTETLNTDPDPHCIYSFDFVTSVLTSSITLDYSPL